MEGRSLEAGEQNAHLPHPPDSQFNALSVDAMMARYERIERYLDNDMTPPEREAFEALMAQDDDWREEVDIQRDMREWETQGVPTFDQWLQERDAQLRNIRRRRIRKHIRSGLALAACVVGLVQVFMPNLLYWHVNDTSSISDITLGSTGADKDSNKTSIADSNPINPHIADSNPSDPKLVMNSQTDSNEQKLCSWPNLINPKQEYTKAQACYNSYRYDSAINILNYNVIPNLDKPEDSLVANLLLAKCYKESGQYEKVKECLAIKDSILARSGSSPSKYDKDYEPLNNWSAPIWVSRQKERVESWFK
ncbi:MAG: hypothetical protein HC842_00505 [Cytophagales bacterium]|nr:hypothetical protein [Cytophagales bacterium]